MTGKGEGGDNRKPGLGFGGPGRVVGAVAAVGATIALSIAVLGPKKAGPDLPGSQGARDRGEPAAGVSTRSAPAVASAGTLCLPGIIDNEAGCVPAGTTTLPLAAAVDLSASPITLVSGDAGVPERQVSSCAEFAALYRQGWGGLTSADMRREARVLRACGFAALAGRSAPMPGAAPLSTDVLDALDRATLPNVGEASFGEDSVFVQESSQPPLWTLQGAAQIGHFLHIGTVDFDGDPEPDHLIEWTISAREGTLSASGFAVVEDEGRIPRFRIIEPFGT